MTVQCCKCKRVRRDEHWCPEALAATAPKSHTYCPECLLEAHVEIFNERASVSRVRHARELLHSLPLITAG